VELIILRAGDAAPPVAARRGQFGSWIQREIGEVWPGLFLEHDVRTEAPLPGPRDAAGFVITGSSSNVTEGAPWMKRTEQLIRDIASAGTPLFGICFGHQIVAEALGGRVGKNPRGREIGTVEARSFEGAEDEPILRGVPRRFLVNTTHVETVLSLPKGARVLAETDLEPHAVFAIGARVKCVQFHPEIDGDAMRGYVEARAHLIEAEGRSAAPLAASAADTPHAADTLRNFVRHVVLAV
jgi:GMP synthase (glutamine-hydrolysing)